MGFAVLLHVLAVVVWVGGMFFAHQVLRPVAVEQLQPPQRLTLWVGVFGRFFPWVWVSVVTVLCTGFWVILSIFGGFANLGLYVHIMTGLGILMVLIYGYVYFMPYMKLKAAVSAEDWQAGGAALATIRMLVGVNLSLGLLTVAVASGGRYLLP